MVCQILLGERKTGAAKRAGKQQDLLCLSYVEKISGYGNEITDVLGTYKEPSVKRPWWALYPSPKAKNFVFVINSARYTTPDQFIWLLDPETIDDEYAVPPDGRAYTFDVGAYKGGRNPHGGDFIDEVGDMSTVGNAQFDHMVESFASYSVPSVDTAVGQAKRAMALKARNPTAASAKPCKQRARVAPVSAPAARPRSRHTVPAAAASAPSRIGKRKRYRAISEESEEESEEESWNSEDEVEEESGEESGEDGCESE